jgi:ATP-dependent protease ClpP protease subunit
MGRKVMADYKRRYIMIDLPKGSGAIHEGIAEGADRILTKMNHGGPSQPIMFFLHVHDGGDFYACLKIAQSVARSSSPVIMVPFIRVRSGGFLLTQAGEGCFATPGTRFIFHHATDYFLAQNLKDHKLSQKDYEHRMNNLKRIDAMQLIFFTKRGRPIKRIFDLFGKEANLSTAHAKRLGLVQDVFDLGELKRIRAELHSAK